MSDERKPSERQVTEDLLSGFDRPGRSPRAPPVRMEFQANAPAAGAETVLVTRRRQAPLWPWLVAAFVCSAGLGIVGFFFAFAAKPPPTTASTEVVPATDSAFVAAPPSSASTAAPVTSSSAPPPPPHPAQTSAKAAPAPVPAPAPTPKKPEHRGDFVQDL